MSSPRTAQHGVADSADEEAATSDRAPQAEGSPAGDLDEECAAILGRIGELREYALYYVAANIDRLRLSARAAVVWCVLAVVASLIAVSIVATASVLLVVSLSTGVGELMGARTWLGQLVVSAAILLAASGGVWLVLRRRLNNYRRTIVEKYELRKEEERAEYGTSVEQRAKERPQNA
jgi:membrane protein implicated in regulation of membrane protease activity